MVWEDPEGGGCWGHPSAIRLTTPSRRTADQGHPRPPDGSCKWLHESAQVLCVCHRVVVTPLGREETTFNRKAFDG